MHLSAPRPRRARAVADAPVDALLKRAEELAKGWLLALVEQAPLARASSILATELARDGPAICAALVRALRADEDLKRIAAGGELERLVSSAGALAGARSPEEASRAVETMRAVIWSALLDALPDPDCDQLAQLAERLSLVAEVTRGAALRRLAGPGEPSPAMYDWPRALEAEITRSRREGMSLSLLLLELEEAERMLAVAPAQEAAATFDRFAGLVRASVRPGDLLVCENASRVWVLAPGIGREGAEQLGSDLAGAVRTAESWRGAPLRVSVGVAVLDEQADDAAGLIELAEEARFAAAARGIEIRRGGSEPQSS
jgi:GGDEF domain-containing protein